MTELASYQEDPVALSQFEKRFAVPCQVGFLSAFAGILAAVFFAKGELWPISLTGFGLFLLAVSFIVMFYSIPLSVSGRPMKNTGIRIQMRKATKSSTCAKSPKRISEELGPKQRGLTYKLTTSQSDAHFAHIHGQTPPSWANFQ